MLEVGKLSLKEIFLLMKEGNPYKNDSFLIHDSALSSVNNGNK